MNPGTVIIHLIRPAGCGDAAGAEVLTEQETRRAAAFRFPQDAAHWISCRAALRRILADLTGIAPREIPLEQSAFGKPCLAPPFDGIHFNLSHCRDLALLAVCTDGPVGIDLEPLDRAGDLCGCEATFCHPDEITRLPDDASRPLRLLEIWTAKEALLKAIGTGFSIAPESVRIETCGGIMTAAADCPPEAAAGIVIRRPPHPALAGHLAAVATPVSVDRFEFASCPGSTSDVDCAMNPADSRLTDG